MRAAHTILDRQSDRRPPAMLDPGRHDRLPHEDGTTAPNDRSPGDEVNLQDGKHPALEEETGGVEGLTLENPRAPRPPLASAGRRAPAFQQIPGRHPPEDVTGHHPRQVAHA